MTSPTLIPYIEALERLIALVASVAPEGDRMRDDLVRLRALVEAMKKAVRCSDDEYYSTHWIIPAPKEEA